MTPRSVQALMKLRDCLHGLMAGRLLFRNFTEKTEEKQAALI